MPVEQLFEQRVIPAVICLPPAHHLQPQGQPQQALPGQVLDQPPAFQVLQPAAGPLPLQQFTRRARNLGDAQAGKIRGDLTDQFQIGRRELAPGKGQWRQIRLAYWLWFGLPE